MHQLPSQSRAVACAIALAAFALCLMGHAANTSGAEILFEAGRKALEAQDYELACQKFQESNRLEPAPGTVLNIGNCEEKRGRIATAWARYTEAMNMLPADDNRYAFARKRAEAIEHRVPRLTVTLAKDSPPGTTLTRNGKEWQEPFGAPLRLDPQTYLLVVTAPKHERAKYHVSLKEGDNKELTVAPGKPTVKPTPQPGSERKRLGLIVGGAGAGVALLGVTFGVLTYVDYRIVKQECDIAGRTCNSDRGGDAARRGGAFEILAYSLSGVGAAGLAVGGYLLLHQGQKSTAALELGQEGAVSTFRLHATF